MTEPKIDPITGKPVDGNGEGGGDAPKVEIPVAELENLKGRLDAFEKMGAGGQFGQPAQPAPAAPAQPAGPTVADQVKEIDDQIAALNTQIDEATTNAKPVSALLGQRDELNLKKTRILVNEDIAPALATGVQTIEQLSERVTSGDMPHLSLVKEDFDAALQNLTPEQRMNPEVRKQVYNLAVGQNMDKIVAAKEEEILRKASEQQTSEPPGGNARTTNAGSATTPKPEDVLSRGALTAISAVGKTPDEYYKSRGYEGWSDFWEKRGKEYFGDVAGA